MVIKVYTPNIRSLVINQFNESLLESELKYIASDLLLHGFRDMHQINEAINRSMQICLSSSLSIRTNFKPIYISKRREIMCDWKLSTLGRKLVLVNADASIPLVAKFQMELLNHKNGII